MAILAYQVTGFAYQGIGQFAYQGSIDSQSGLTKTGTGGIDPGEAQRRVPFKPTGIIERPKKKEGRKDVEDRVDESRDIQADIAAKLAREFKEETLRRPQEAEAPLPVEQMSLTAIEQEIGAILRKKVRTQEEETLLLVMMAAA